MDALDVSTHLMSLYANNRQTDSQKGWREIGQLLGISGAYAREIALGKKPVTPKIAEAWLRLTGRQLPKREAPVCPTCLRLGKIVVHSVDCHGLLLES